MTGPKTTELLLIRHAPTLAAGRLCGRTDVAADCSAGAAFGALRAALGHPDRIVVSPAQRCRQTADTLWPAAQVEIHPALWEQDFGAWEGHAYSDLPDLGRMPTLDLAHHRPPAGDTPGESFADLCDRVWPVLRSVDTGGRVALVVHAGVIRAALSMVLHSVAAGLRFQIAPLSLTRIVNLGQDEWSIAEVNRAAQ
ncbi:alpha-ribazole phosphatase [Albidovulum inexpectatum]|uniref:Alpha-ribazole phosphatase n=1 Tax=Albidovulum inexpectatum TaxID=196587 RepID=A0A2S5JE30_9RHOB|nr:histidine phosphatase family protein [Albidovulum inexpectatum]PPB79555.1 alpha-ribazole phosphatase [Albidovulum inexpectatum]